MGPSCPLFMHQHNAAVVCGKAVTLRPTAEGEALVEKHKRCIAAHNAKLYEELSDYSPEEIETLFQMVTRLARFYREQ